MTNEIALNNETALAISDLGIAKYADDKSFDIVANGAAWLPRVMLMGSNSTAVKEGKINQGRYAFVRTKDNLDDLTPEVPVLVLSWRPKAMHITDSDVLSVYNPSSQAFKNIAAEADSGKQDTGCMYGPEFLLWVPSVRGFGTYFMSSKTSRREAPNLKSLMGKSALLKCQLIKANKYAWHGPVVTMYSQPLTALPTQDELIEQVTKFNSPPETEKEEAPADSDRVR